MVSVDFFTVPTIAFRPLCLPGLAHERRRIIHSRSLLIERRSGRHNNFEKHFLGHSAAPSLARRDSHIGHEFVEQIKAMRIEEVLSAPRSPWQRAYVERLIGTIRRECLDHVIVFNENCLRRHVQSFTDYYHWSRTHLSLDKDAPEPRPIQPRSAGETIAIPEVGGLHHRYERRAA